MRIDQESRDIIYIDGLRYYSKLKTLGRCNVNDIQHIVIHLENYFNNLVCISMRYLSLQQMNKNKIDSG